MAEVTQSEGKENLKQTAGAIFEGFIEDIIIERFIAKRVVKLFYLVFLCGVCGILYGFLHGMHLGETVSLFLLNILFGALFVFYLESGRLHRLDEPDASEDYGRICAYFTAGVFLMLAASFLPEYTVPAAMAAFLLTAGLDREQALAVSIFFMIQIAFDANSTVAIACYFMLALFGVVLTSMYEQKPYRRYAEMIMLAVSVSVPTLFYYLAYEKVDWKILLFGFLSGALGMLGMHFLYDPLHARLVWSNEISLDTIVDPSYHLVREIKRYSQVDYNHAIRVSKIAGHCAAVIGADVKLSAVGGFYYRLGKLGGDPVVENGVIIAQNNCFPNAVIKILSEYNGKRSAISSIESAIIHITDAVVTKFELLDHTTLTSAWNRDMVIYQTMNEKSSSGIYDKSGLTMNQFLKIREFLAKEEELL